MDRLDRAIAEFEDETLDLTLSERVSGLRQALMWNVFCLIKKIKKYGKKSPVSAEEEYKHVECMKYYRDIEKMYASEIRMNKLTGKSEDIMNNAFLAKIKEMKGSIGDIITTIPQNNTNGV